MLGEDSKAGRKLESFVLGKREGFRTGVPRLQVVGPGKPEQVELTAQARRLTSSQRPMGLVMERIFGFLSWVPSWKQEQN